MTTQDLQRVGDLRQALKPLIEVMKVQANVELEKRLALIESALTELAKRDTVINVSSPEVSVDIDTSEFTQAIKDQVKLITKNSETPEPPSRYEPHDQAKTTTFQYSGFVRDDGVWYIQRVAKGEQRYAKGQGDYRSAWERRSKHKYGDIDS